MSEALHPLEIQEYWSRHGEQGFVLPRCQDCQRFHFYPRPACPHCGGTHLVLAPASGKAVVHSYSVVHRAPKAEFAQDVPYVVAIVKTDEGPCMMTRVVNMDPERVHIGLRVQVCPESIQTAPVFRPEEDSHE